MNDVQRQFQLSSAGLVTTERDGYFGLVMAERDGCVAISLRRDEPFTSDAVP